MKPMIRSVLAAAAAIVLAAPALAAGDAARGKAAFVKYGCWQCHGFEGQGSIATSNGKVLTHEPPPWEGFSGLVRSSNTAMPPYSEKILPERDLEDIYAWLTSQPKPADYKSIPLLNQ